jgi:hypothetical protein
MEPDRLARLAFWVFAAGNLAWAIQNGITGNGVNVATDLVVVVGAVVAAWGLRDAVDGLGPGRFRTGLWLVAIPEFGQNVVTATTKLGAGNATPVLAVLAASVLLAVGTLRWVADGWERAALPWLALGFAGLAFEPLYYFTLNLATQGGTIFGSGFFPGILGVSIGGLLLAWAFRPWGEVEPLGEPEPPEAAAKRRGGRAQT